MTPDLFNTRIVEPTLQFMAASPSIGIPVTDAARVEVMAIAGQESRWKYRKQIGGPAHSYWQFERGGGVAGLFSHPATKLKLGTVCAALDIEYDPDVVYQAMIWNDTLACAMARLLLYSDAAPLPAVGDKEAGWAYYQRTWRPGLPHPEAWPGVYQQSLAAIGRA
ncbi:hypothetical protein [Reyranella sp.]|uniref:hypothetical protein n=1 Tax=Reyranella sp. TaxID=1929291 RepID=UPI003D0CB0F8